MWWVFVVLGIVLMILEIITPGFIIMWFGVSFIIAAIPAYFHAPFAVVLSTFTLALLLLSVFVRRIFVGKFSGKNRTDTNTAALIGEQGVITETVDGVHATGKVRVHSEIWSALSDTGAIIPVGMQVRVLRVEGVKLVVEQR
jgi:membrane protein implicated in regulation of membrane protease activity